MNTSRLNRKHTAAEVKCDHCGLHRLCQLAGLDEDDSAFDQRVERRQKVGKGRYLFHAGDPFQGVFAVKSGIFKSICCFSDEREQVTSFHLPGELIGLEAIGEGVYSQSVIAIDDSNVCEMNFAEMEKMDNRLVDFQYSVIQALSQKIQLDQYQSLIIGAQNVEQQLAVFLISIYDRLKTNNMPVDSFRIPLRKEIANYLGLAVETVVRVLKQFEEKQLIEINVKQVSISNYDELLSKAGLQQCFSDSRVA